MSAREYAQRDFTLNYLTCEIITFDTMKKIRRRGRRQTLNRVVVPVSGFRVGEYGGVNKLPESKSISEDSEEENKSAWKALGQFRLVPFLERLSVSKLS